MEPVKYTLYHSHYSLPSIIARFLVAMRGESSDGVRRNFEECAVDIFAGEQMSAFFRERVDIMEEVSANTRLLKTYR